ncbi:MAG: phosphoribosylformylglycinamidine cyclo-ligase, partial [Phycisphaerae bacterium]
VLSRLGITRAEMFRVFNMGVGFVLFVRPRFANGVMRILRSEGERPFLAGRVIRGRQRVQMR